MKNVKRRPMPDILRKNSKKWTQNLLDAITEFRTTGKKIPDSVKNKYKHDEVLDVLKQIYNDGYGTYYCCYCETQIEPVSFPHIEHRKPKEQDRFPEDAFNWDNLHLSCQTCNMAKGTKWDAKNKILDAVNDVPIKKHLGYRVEMPEGVFRETLTKRGITTENHTDLNRKSLRIARLKIWHSIIKRIQEINSFGDGPRAHTAKKILIEKCKGIHGSLIKWILIEWKVIGESE